MAHAKNKFDIGPRRDTVWFYVLRSKHNKSVFNLLHELLKAPQTENYRKSALRSMTQPIHKRHSVADGK